jgi:hypothetical protein
MICASCGLETNVFDSRPYDAGVRRRRVCANGHRFVTWETTTWVPTTKPRPVQTGVLERAKRADRDRRRYESLDPEAKRERLFRQKLRRAGVEIPSQ